MNGADDGHDDDLMVGSDGSMSGDDDNSVGIGYYNVGEWRW